MAEELKKAQAAWAACSNKMSGCFAELASAAQTQANLQDWLGGARVDLVDRVLDAKRRGVPGKTLAEFRKDGDIAKAWAEIEAVMGKLRAAHERFEKGVAACKPVHAEAQKLLGHLDAEVKSRKKKLFDSKSIPDLEKLSKTIAADLDRKSPKLLKSFEEFATQGPKKFSYDAAYQKQMEVDIARDINSVKAAAASVTLERQLQLRHLAAVGKQVGDLCKLAIEQCSDAVGRHKTGDNKAASAALKGAITKVDAAQKHAEDLQKALKAHATALKTSKDGAAILKKADSINAAVTAALKQVAATQKAVG